MLRIYRSEIKKEKIVKTKEIKQKSVVLEELGKGVITNVSADENLKKKSAERYLKNQMYSDARDIYDEYFGLNKQTEANNGMENSAENNIISDLLP